MEGHAKRLAVAAAVVAAAITLTTASAGATTTVSHLSFRARLAIAQFDSTIGCVETHAQVSAEVSLERTGPGSLERVALADASLFQFDHCANVSLVQSYGRARVSRNEFQIDSLLTSAHIDTRFRMYEQLSATYFSMDVNATWTGTGPAQVMRTVFRERRNGSTVINILRDTRRDADATGSFTRGGTTVLSGGSFYGLLHEVNDVNLEMDHT
jgi:hypothetical protein